MYSSSDHQPCHNHHPVGAVLDRNFYSIISSETWSEYIKVEEGYLKYLEVYMRSIGQQVKHGVLTLLNLPPTHLWDFSPLGLTPTAAQPISAHPPPPPPPTPGDLGPWPLKRSELSGFWKMHGCYVYKYFVNNLAILFFYY